MAKSNSAEKKKKAAKKSNPNTGYYQPMSNTDRLKKQGIWPYKYNIPADIFQALKDDKKVNGGDWHFILSKRLRQAYNLPIPE